MVADALSRVPGSDLLSDAQFCTSMHTLDIAHVDTDFVDIDYDLQCSGVLTLYENESFLR